MVDPVTIAKAAATLLTNEKARKGVGWALAAILSPVILVLVFLFVLASGAASGNISVAELCFNDGAIPASCPEEYAEHIRDVRTSFDYLDGVIEEVNGMIEDEGKSLDDVQIKSVFFALFFDADTPSAMAHRQFVDAFVSYEFRNRTVTRTDESGNEVELEETYTAAVPVEDLEEVYDTLEIIFGMEIAPDQKTNASNIYSLIKYGAAGSGELFEGSDTPYLSVNGFCSPVGANWRSIVTSEFGNRIDPITGQRDGHTGMDLAVPSGTPVRAALAGTVTVARYYGSYGYCVMIDHGNGLVTLYGHNSRLLVQEGQTVEAGQVISQSGATGRVTGPHLHFEVRVNGERTNPRYYLP